MFLKIFFRIFQIFFKFSQMFLKIHSKLLSFRKYFSKLKQFIIAPTFPPPGRKFGYGPERRNLLIRPLRRNVLKDLSSVAVVQGSVVNICKQGADDIRIKFRLVGVYQMPMFFLTDNYWKWFAPLDTNPGCAPAQ